MNEEIEKLRLERDQYKRRLDQKEVAVTKGRRQVHGHQKKINLLEQTLQSETKNAKAAREEADLLQVRVDESERSNRIATAELVKMKDRSAQAQAEHEVEIAQLRVRVASSLCKILRALLFSRISVVCVCVCVCVCVSASLTARTRRTQRSSSKSWEHAIYQCGTTSNPRVERTKVRCSVDKAARAHFRIRSVGSTLQSGKPLFGIDGAIHALFRAFGRLTDPFDNTLINLPLRLPTFVFAGDKKTICHERGDQP